MERVTFTYETMDRPALDDVSFNVEAGGTLAIVGPSGAGKTTAAHLFLRFWDAESGTVRMDGADLREYRLDDLRNRIALVSQDTYLFNASLRQNVLIARPEAGETELRTAVESASLADFVDSLPDGLDTLDASSSAPRSRLISVWHWQSSKGITGLPDGSTGVDSSAGRARQSTVPRASG